MIGAAFGFGFIFGPALGGLSRRQQPGHRRSRKPRLGSPPGCRSRRCAACCSCCARAARAEARRRRARARAGSMPIRGALRRPVLSRLILVFFLVILAFAAMESTFALWAIAAIRLGTGAGRLCLRLCRRLVGDHAGRADRPPRPSASARSGCCCRSWCCSRSGSRHRAVRRATWPVLGVAISGAGARHGADPAVAEQPGLAPRRRAASRAQVLGVTQSVGSLARVLGPALAGCLFADLGRSSPFWSGAGLVAVAFVLAFNLFRRARCGTGRSSPSRRWARRDEPARAADHPRSAAAEGPAQGRIAGAASSLAPYLWPRNSAGLRLRVVLAIGPAGRRPAVNIAVPFLYKHAVDALTPRQGGRSPCRWC